MDYVREFRFLIHLRIDDPWGRLTRSEQYILLEDLLETFHVENWVEPSQCLAEWLGRIQHTGTLRDYAQRLLSGTVIKPFKRPDDICFHVSLGSFWVAPKGVASDVRNAQVFTRDQAVRRAQELRRDGKDALPYVLMRSGKLKRI